MDTIQVLENRIQSLGSTFRSAPFWAWNDRLEQDELDFQIHQMKKQGMGGFFIHSREGLETPYLSQEWMDDVRHAVKTAGECGMEAWIYDEDKWPSGSAGGLVSQADRRRFSAKAVTLEVLTPSRADSMPELINGREDGDVKLLAVCAVRLEGTYILEKGPYRSGLSDGWRILALRREISSGSEWYNGHAPTDNLNPDAVRKFIELTHEKYKASCGEEFGGIIRGFFTDEPNFCDFYSSFAKGRPWIPWSDGFSGFFLQKRGYEIEEYLPYLFYDGDNCGKYRHDFWRTMTERFCEAYTSQLYGWCENNRLALTGHMLYENDLGYSIRVCGAAMPHYRYMHAPGIDILGEQTREYLTVKQCTSVARQFNRGMVVSETYGCTGWDFTFEGQKWLGDWQFVMGVTRRCQHLALYSISGCRKRDYPPVFNYNTTWWKDNHILEDYFARLNAFTTAGDVIRHILVIHPVSSLWMQCRSDAKEDFTNIEMNMGWLDSHITALNEKGEEYNTLAESLLGAHMDFDFGDELIMADCADVTPEGLRVEACRYDTVVVPSVATLFDTTVTLLEEFLLNGGTVYWVKPFINYVNGEKSDAARRLLRCPNLILAEDYGDLLRLLQENLRPVIRVRTPLYQEDTSILTMVRRLEDGYTVIAVNNDRSNRHPVQFQFPHTGRVTAYELLTGQSSELPVRIQNGVMYYTDTFAPAASRVYTIHTGEQPTEGSAAFPYEHPHRADKVWLCLGPCAETTRDMENVLVLDKCRFQIENNSLSGETDVWRAQKSIRKTMSLRQVYYNGAPQRYGWIQEPCGTDGRKIHLRFSFTVRDIPLHTCYVAVEKPDGLTVSCNGVALDRDNGYFLDKSIARFELPVSLLRKGKNEIELDCLYRNSMELEDIYIIGRFDVNMDRTITAETSRLHFGDWTSQGLYHYPGSITYHFDIDRPLPMGKELLLKLGKYQGTLVKIKVNGSRELICIGSAHTQALITPYMKQGKNRLSVEVVGSPRNMFGPFHQTYTGCSRISWEDFRTSGRFYTPEYVLEPYGLYGQITICEI